MPLSVAARSRWILAFVLLAAMAVAGVWRLRQRPRQYPVAYVGDRAATLWSTTAQVREPIATLHYGQRVAVLRRLPDQTEVRTDAGAQGWIDARLLMDAALWQRSSELLQRAHTMPVQATGRTRTLSNVHVDPSRDAARIFQFGRDVPVVVLERKPAVIPASASVAAEDSASPATSGKTAGEKTDAGKTESGKTESGKTEDWLLVSRVISVEGSASPAPASSPDESANESADKSDGSPDSALPKSTGSSASPASPVSSDASQIADAGASDIPMAGWVLSRFIELTPPQPIPDYSNAAGMRVVAWVVLDTVADAGGEKPQYLVAGTRGSDDPACDFTLLRAYTWGAARQRYETAYVEDKLCGQLPIRVRMVDGNVEFSFVEAGQSSSDHTADRVYVMKQTVIRLVGRAGAEARSSGRRRR